MLWACTKTQTFQYLASSLHILGGPEKWNGILPTICRCHNWYQCMWNFSWEKWYQDQKFGFKSSNLYCRAHGLLLTAVASQNGIHSHLKRLSFWPPTLFHKISLRKQATEAESLILLSFSSGEITSYTDTNYYIPHIVGNMPFHFYGPPCISYCYVGQPSGKLSHCHSWTTIVPK